MLISEYLALRNQISVTTGNTAVRTGESTAKDAVQNGSGTFAQALQENQEGTVKREDRGGRCPR